VLERGLAADRRQCHAAGIERALRKPEHGEPSCGTTAEKFRRSRYVRQALF
jgi:hypothetical protein